MNVTENSSGKFEPLSKPASGRRKWFASGLVLTSSVLALGWICWSKESVVLPKHVSRAEYDAACLDFADLFHRKPTPPDVMMLLAETALRDDRPEVAVDCFARVSSEHPRYGASARLQEAQVLLRSNRAKMAEDSFRAFLKLAQNKTSIPQEHVRLARDWLVFMLAVELRIEDRKLILQQMIQERQFDVYDAKQYYFPTLLIWQSTLGSSRLREFLEQSPEDRRLLIAEARYRVAEGRLDAASRLLESLRQQDPGDSNVIAASLECLYEQVNWTKFESILAAAPAFASDEPWLLTHMRAEFAVHRQDWGTAELHFRHMLTADPANPACHMGLAKALLGLGRTEDRKALQERSLILARIRVNLAAAGNNSATAIRVLAQDARSLQMDEAADSFEYLADRIDGGVR